MLAVEKPPSRYSTSASRSSVFSLSMTFWPPLWHVAAARGRRQAVSTGACGAVAKRMTPGFCSFAVVLALTPARQQRAAAERASLWVRCAADDRVADWLLPSNWHLDATESRWMQTADRSL